MEFHEILMEIKKREILNEKMNMKEKIIINDNIFFITYDNLFFHIHFFITYHNL